MRKFRLYFLIIFLVAIVLVELYLLGYMEFLKPNRTPQQPTPINPSSNRSPIIERTIAVTSETDLIKLSLVNEALLMQYLNDFGFWNKMSFFNGALEGKIIDQMSIAVVLTDSINQSDQYQSTYENTDGFVYQGEGVGIRNGKLSLLIYLSPEILQTTDYENLSKRINAMLLRSIYNLSQTNNSDLNPDEADKIIKDMIAEFIASGHKFIEIQK